MNVPDIYKLLFWIAFLLITLYILYNWTVRAYLRRRAIRRNGEQTTAKIMHYDTIEMYEEPDKQIFYRYYLEFTTKTGEKVVIQPEEDKPYQFAPGTELTVHYLKDDPNQFYIKGLLPFQSRFLPLGVIIVGYCLYNIAAIVLQHS